MTSKADASIKFGSSTHRWLPSARLLDNLRAAGLTTVLSLTTTLLMPGFVISVAHAAPPVTNFEYDANGNLTKVTDGLNHATVNTYDKLNRRISSTDANTGLSQYAYNALDQMTQVTDPKTLVTSYNYDGLSNLNQQISPDTGTTANTYDISGNVLTSTDAKGQVTTYSYDSLNRVTLITYHDNSTIAYGYDQGINGTRSEERRVGKEC